MEDLVPFSDRPALWTYEHADPAGQGAIECVAVVLAKRPSGVLVAIPQGVISEDELAAAREAQMDDILGPSVVLEAPSIEDSGSLALEWAQGLGDSERVQFYSADEGPAGDPQKPKRPVLRLSKHDPPTQPAGATTGAPAAGPKATAQKRPTTAALASQLETLSSSLPALVKSMEEMANRQAQMEKQLATGPAAALSQPLGIRSKAPAAPPLAALGPPPRTARIVSAPPPEGAGQAEAEAVEALDEYGGPTQQRDPLAQAVLEQSKALTTLVAQLSSSFGDGLVDLGGLSSQLSSRGASQRARMQDELSAGRGTFYTAVLQNMARRMSPAVAPSADPSELLHQGVCLSRYWERFGGFAGQRDLGAIAHCLAQALDCLQAGSVLQASDHLSLLAVCMETDVHGLWPCRAWVSIDLVGRPPGGYVHRTGGTQQPAHPGFCTPGFAKVGGDCPELCERIGCHTDEEAGHAQGPAAARRWFPSGRRHRGELAFAAPPATSKEADLGGEASAPSPDRPCQGTATTAFGTPGATFEGLIGPPRFPNPSAPLGQFTATLSFREWAAALPRWVAKSRTLFGAMLCKSFLSPASRRGTAPSSATFPLPLPHLGLFAGSGPGLSSARWRRLRLRRVLHVLVLGLNFVYEGLRPLQFDLLWREPNAHQRSAYDRLWRYLVACDSRSDRSPSRPVWARESCKTS